jgi:hypothetical protein
MVRDSKHWDLANLKPMTLTLSDGYLKDHKISFFTRIISAYISDLPPNELPEVALRHLAFGECSINAT